MAEEVKDETTPAEGETKKEEVEKGDTEKSSGNKAETEAAEKEVDKEGLKDRLLFFFSDSNLRHDGYMRKILVQEPHKIEVSALLRFNTIKKYTTDPAILVEVAKTMSDLLVVSDDDKAIGRVNPFTMEMMDNHVPVSLYVFKLPIQKGAKEGRRHYGIQRTDLEELFAPYGKIGIVHLRFFFDRSNKRRVPKGNAWVEFTSMAALGAAADDTLTVKGGKEVKPKRKLEVKGADGETIQLGVELLSEHEEIKKEKRNTRLENNSWNKDDNKSPSKKREHEETKKFTLDWKPGCVIRLEGLSTTDCDREALLESVGTCLSLDIAKVKEKRIYIDYSRGQGDGALRFREPGNDVKAVCEKLSSGEVKLKGSAVKAARILEGDEEKKYWDAFIEFKNKQIAERGNKKQRR